ncbi:unnamed protein product [Hydatigera taeniaeformis]|uniref:Uncharacterized protein n=1 Tax=Hydatigena taeniaeformis TaxID=6205 RepID=A0A3P7G2E8_HYDTA|nr:unnamed protein product [Hydatigera taeniaeformis]
MGERFASFDIASEGVKSSILPEGFNYVPKSNRKLPQSDASSPSCFRVLEFIPEGKITIQQAVDMIRSYQLEGKTVFQLAEDYDPDKSMVASVCRYFALFERDDSDVWVPPRGSKDTKTLLDTPIYEEDEQIADEGTSRRLRLHVPKFTLDQ